MGLTHSGRQAHGVKATREHGTADACTQLDSEVLADMDCQGVDDSSTTRSNRRPNRLTSIAATILTLPAYT